VSRILVIDDEPAIGWSLREMLTDDGHAVDLAASVAEGLAAAATTTPDVVLLDVRLPGRDGIDAIPDLRAVAAAAPIVVMTAFGDLDTAVRAVRAGAFDFLVKPFDLDHVAAVVARARTAGRWAGDASAADDVPPALVGTSPAMQALVRRIAQVAAGDAPALIIGPPGSGKTLAARAIHAHGRRHDGPFVATSLAALAPAARAAELFAAGSGLVDRAAGGTLFVSDIEAAPADVQDRLAGMIETVGTAAPPRLLAASSRPLDTLGLEPALASRLRTTLIEVPALADRGADLELLVHSILDRQAASAGRTPPAVAPAFLAALRGRDWPGNVRDLKAAVEHAAVVAQGRPLDPAHLPAAARTAGPVESAMRGLSAAVREWAAAARAEFARLPEPDLHNRTVRLVEATLLREALAHTGGNRTAAARLLGLDRATLRTKLRQAGLDE
jgi:two-component system nitrogen regulation response regulator GlnG